MQDSQSYFAFDGSRRIAAGSYVDVALEVSAYLQNMPQAQPLVFDALTGKQIDLDLRGGIEDILQRAAAQRESATQKPGKGRPRLGVVAKEVTLLPRHWDWLSAQPGGASVTLRKLIERASKDPESNEQQQARAAAAYNFMHAVAGNLPGFEEASRLLFAGKSDGLSSAINAWPGDVAAQVMLLLNVDAQPQPA